MGKSPGYISVRQAAVLMFVGFLSPLLDGRLVYQLGFLGAPAWLAPLISALPMLLMTLAMHYIFRGRDDAEGLCEVTESLLGKAFSKVLFLVFLFWQLALTVVCARNFAERYLRVLFKNEHPEFFLLSLFVILFFVGRGRLSALARTGEVFALILGAVLLLLLFFAAIGSVDYKNLLPVTREDLLPVAGAGLLYSGPMLTPFFILFLGDKIREKKQILSVWYKFSLIVPAVVSMTLIIAIGTFGQKLALSMENPLFSAVKSLKIFGSFERSEALIVSIWALSDFVLIAVSLFICQSLLKKTFSLEDSDRLGAPLLASVYFITLLIINSPRAFEAAYLALSSQISLILAGSAILLLTAAALLRGLAGRGKKEGKGAPPAAPEDNNSGEVI